MKLDYGRIIFGEIISAITKKEQDTDNHKEIRFVLFPCFLSLCLISGLAHTNLRVISAYKPTVLDYPNARPLFTKLRQYIRDKTIRKEYRRVRKSSKLRASTPTCIRLLENISSERERKKREIRMRRLGEM